MSPRKTRTAAIQATKALQTAKKQPTRAKKKPEPKKKQPVKSRNTTKNKNQKKLAQATKSHIDKTSSENTSRIISESGSKKQLVPKRNKVIPQDRLLSVINQIASNVGERVSVKDVKIDTQTEEIPLTQAVQEQEEEYINGPETTEQRTIYSCKFCNKDFSSAFVLFLHIRIHEKVASVQEPVEEVVTEPTKVEKPHVKEEDSDDELQIKEEVIEEITIPDADDEPEESVAIDPLKIEKIENEPKTEFVGIINKNFVANLRKNLSLAMNRQIN